MYSSVIKYSNQVEPNLENTQNYGSKQFKQIDKISRHLQSFVKSTRFCQFHDINCNGKKCKFCIIKEAINFFV